MDFRLLLLAFGAFAGTTESTLVPGLLPAIGTTMGVSVAQAGYLVVVYSIAYGGASFTLAALALTLANPPDPALDRLTFRAEAPGDE